MGRGLVQTDVDLGVTVAQLGHCLRQNIACLRVRGCNAQGAAVLCAKLLTNALQIAYLAHDDFNAFENVLSRLCNALEALSVASKDINAQFLFQLNDGFGYAGLRGVQGLGSLGQVEVSACSLLHKTELVEIHKAMTFKMLSLL